MVITDDDVSESSSDSGLPNPKGKEFQSQSQSQSTRKSKGQGQGQANKQKCMSKTKMKLPPSPPCEIEVFPKAITFDCVEPGLVYALTFQFQNRSSNTKRIRVIPPTTSAYTLSYLKVGSLASGLVSTASISFQMPLNSAGQLTFTDSVTVVSESASVVIPLSALRPSAQIDFDSLANLGFCCVGVPASKQVVLRNVGAADGSFRINYSPDLPIKITPCEGRIPKGRSHAAAAAAAAASPPCGTVGSSTWQSASSSWLTRGNCALAATVPEALMAMPLPRVMLDSSCVYA